ncbi:hypothetical protein [Pantoea sp. BAV 3049]|uniref:hypothetical protein n=1 Tax=Pantoea sp. BAV 3049 TaxID=2654188 RepID=UPI00131D7431|nr:hypothetical protein [Pantoea sp. BAV 3049]
MSAYAIVNKDGLVDNVILWDAKKDPDYDYGKDNGFQAIIINEGVIVGPGFTYTGGEFVAPVLAE